MNETGTPLNTLYETNEIVLAAGRHVAIKKVSMRNLKAVLDILHSIIKTLKVEDGVSTANLLDPNFVLQLISNNVDAVYGLAVMHSSLTLDELMDLEIDEGVTVVAAILKLNIDFFTTKVQPQLTALVAPPSGK